MYPKAFNQSIRKNPLKTPFSRQRRCGFQPWRSAIRKTVPFRTPAGRLAVALSMSALRLGADVHVDPAACPQMTQSGRSGRWAPTAMTAPHQVARQDRCALPRPGRALTSEREMTIGQGFPSPNQPTKPGDRYAICRSRLVSPSTASRATVVSTGGAIRGSRIKGIVVSPLANVRRVILTMQLNPILNGRAGME